MKNSLEKVLWGVVLVVFGVALAGKVIGLYDFNIFFPGWWTLFIIIPSAIGLVSGNNVASNVGGLAVGLMLFMNQTGAIDWQTFVKLLIAVVFVSVGVSFIFPDNKNHNKTYRQDKKKDRENTNWNGEHRDRTKGTETNETETNETETNETETNTTQTHRAVSNEPKEPREPREPFRYNHSQHRNRQGSGFIQYTGFFSVNKDQYIDETFHGAVVTAIMGGVELDLRNAVFLSDTIIDITCIMGGVDIFVPTNMKVVVNCTPIMGGVDCYVKNYNNQDQNQYTLFIKGNCLMGGVEIK